MRTGLSTGTSILRQGCPSQHRVAHGAHPYFHPRRDSSWPCADSRAGQRKGTVSLLCVRRAAGTIVAPPSSCTRRLSPSWSSWPWLCSPAASSFSSAPGHVPQSSWPASRTAARWQWRGAWAPVWRWWGNRRGLWQPTPPHTPPMLVHQSCCLLSAATRPSRTWDQVFSDGKRKAKSQIPIWDQ